MIHECKICNYTTKYKSHFRDHLNSTKHKKIEESTKTYKPKNLPLNTIKSIDKGFENKISSNEVFLKDDKNPQSDVITSNINEHKNQCNKCYLIFSHRHHMLRHNKTCKFDKIRELIGNDKDIHILLSKNICPLCKVVCEDKKGFMKHVNLCILKKTEDNLKFNVLEVELKLLREQLNSSREKEVLLEKNNQNLIKGFFNEQRINMASTCNINGLIQNQKPLKYASVNFCSAPPLENFDNEFKDPYTFFIDYKEYPEVEDDDTKIIVDEKEISKDEYIVDHIIFLVEHKKFVQYFTDRVAYFYKKEEPKYQSLWNFDTSRHNYGVSLKSENKTIWHHDKKGLLTTQKILDPMLKFTIKIIKSYMKKKSNKIQMSTYQLKRIEHLMEFINLVETNTLQPEIIKKLSPIMYLDVTKQLEYIVKDYSDDDSD